MMYFIKTPTKYNDFVSAYRSIDEKYYERSTLEKIAKDDTFIVPKIGFNIEKDFVDFHDLKFTDSQAKQHVINRISQTNIFHLDEKGVKIDSEAQIALDASKSASTQKKQPKKLILDKDFFIFFKNVNAENPYFAIRIVNDELMFRN